MGWIAVDLDGTLAANEGWNNGQIGTPIPAMVERVKAWLEQGQDVRIFTARVAGLYLPNASPQTVADAQAERIKVQAWAWEHIGTRMKVTALKDYATLEIWDDRAIQVEPNTGRRMDGKP